MSKPTVLSKPTQMSTHMSNGSKNPDALHSEQDAVKDKTRKAKDDKEKVIKEEDRKKVSVSKDTQPKDSDSSASSNSKKSLSSSSDGSNDKDKDKENGTKDTAKKAGPRRFRGDVAPFNPSGQTQLYAQQMQYPQAPQPYPQQQFYSQQPQFIYGNQMLPYYPMAMGYPDLMYQQYQFYAMANQFNSPQPYTGHVHANGYVHRKKHPKGQHNHQGHQPYGYQQNGSGSHIIPLDSALPPASQLEFVTPENHGPSPQHDPQHDLDPIQPSQPEVPKYSEEFPQPSTEDQETAQAAEIKAQANQSHPQLQSQHESQHTPASTPGSATTDLYAENAKVPISGPLIFNISTTELAEERKKSVQLRRQLAEAKSARANAFIKQVDGDLAVNPYGYYQLKDHNTNDEYYKHNFPSTKTSNESNDNDSNDPSLSSPKANLNWASILQSSKKQPKSAVATKPASSNVTSEVSAGSSVTAKIVETEQYPQLLGLLAMKLLLDPNFNLDACEMFEVKPRGLTNSGNICYMNAVLQCLVMCEPFNKLLRHVQEKSIGTLGKTSPTPLLDATISFIEDFINIPSSSKPNVSLLNSEGIVVGKPLSPESLYMKLIENPKFKHLKWGQQEDAEEFLGYLLDGLHEEFVKAEASVLPEMLEMLYNKYSQSLDPHLAEQLKLKMKSGARLVRSTESKEVEDSEELEGDHSGWSEVGSGKKVNKKRVMEVEPSPITEIFGGSFRSVLTVPKAKVSQSITIDPYRSILVDISHKEIETIEDALLRITEVEKIPYKIEAGKEVIARKQSFIEKLPQVLILQLKRFSFEHQQPQIATSENGEQDSKLISTHHIGTIEKVMKNIKYGLDLTVPLECLSSGVRPTEKRDYRLIGVVYHHGRNAEGGHYTCDVLRNKREKKWLRIDDTAVETITADMVVDVPDARDKSAYILMYQRV